MQLIKLGKKEIKVLKLRKEEVMVDFTKLLNRGHRQYIDKHMKKRKFGKCEGCDAHALLISLVDRDDAEYEWKLCNSCYNEGLLES